MENSHKDHQYLDVAEAVAKASTCLRRKYGAVCIKDGYTLTTGYNGSPRGTTNCSDCGKCEREERHVPKGSNYELCRAIHAEQNCIINCSIDQLIGSTLYVVGLEADGRYASPEPCAICKRFIRQAGISRVIGRISKDETVEYNVGEFGE